MIKHIVMWKFKSFAQGRTKKENIELVRSMLTDLSGSSDFEMIKSFEFHTNANMKEGMYDALIEMTFDSFDDLDKYRNHPKHRALSAYVSLVRESRAAVDYEI